MCMTITKILCMLLVFGFLFFLFVNKVVVVKTETVYNPSVRSSSNSFKLTSIVNYGEIFSTTLWGYYILINILFVYAIGKGKLHFGICAQVVQL